MPRYFFHLYDDVIALDDEGLELPDDQAAHAKAVENAKALAAAEVLEGRLALHHRIDAEDEGGNVIATVKFKDVVAVED